MASVILPANPSESRPGRFGIYGGRYVPETLMAALRRAGARVRCGQGRRGVSGRARRSAARTTPAGPRRSTSAKRLTEQLGGAKIYLKREDLLHTGAHKINNALGQGLLARRMGKKRIIAETGAGQHGVATATVCALLGLECVVYMGDVDMERQELNVLRMRLLGAEVRGVSLRLEDAEGRHQRGHARLGHQRPHDLLPAGQRAGRASLSHHGARLPPLHQPRDEGADPGEGRPAAHGESSPASAAAPTPSAHSTNSSPTAKCASSASKPAAAAPRWASMRPASAAARRAFCRARISYVLQDEDGQIALTHSVSAGLDYASIGPEHAALHDSGRAEYVSQDDAAALDAVVKLARTEGILPALESAHAVAEALRIAPTLAAQ